MVRHIIVVLLFVLIIIFNPIVLGRLITVDGEIDILWARLLLWIFTILLSVIFFFFIKNPKGLIKYFILNYKNYLLSIFAIIGSLISIEFILRSNFFLPKPKSDSRVYSVDAYEFDYTVHLNSHYFRDGEFVKHKDKDAFRIFLLGDSFVFGSGVKQEDTFDGLLEKRYKEIGVNCEAYNLGIPGTDTSKYLKVAERFKEYKPNLIIVSLYVDSDIATEIKPPSYINSDFNEKISKAITSLKIVQILDKARLDLNFIYLGIKLYGISDFHKAFSLKGKINPWLIVRARVGDNQSYYNLLTERFNTDLTTRKHILAIKETYNNVPFLLLINPSKFQVNTKYLDKLKKIGFIFNKDEVVDRKLQDAIISWAIENGIDYLDVLPVMKKDLNVVFFYDFDDHYNVQGNRLVAKEIYNKLDEMEVMKQRLGDYLKNK